MKEDQGKTRTTFSGPTSSGTTSSSPAFEGKMPVLFSSMFAVQWMCVNLHPGFDSGGAMWFVDLTEHIHGPLGVLFPISMAADFLLNAQLSLAVLKVVNISGSFRVIRKSYKSYLQGLTVLGFILGFFMPKGVLIFMLSNLTFSTMQILLLKYLYHFLMSRLNPSADLLKAAAQHEAEGHLESALQVLREAIEKDPESSEPYIAMGAVQFKKKLCDEAVNQYELAISKATNDDVLVAVHLYAGFVLLSQEKRVEAIAHLRKITAFEEPVDLKSKSLYYQGLFLLASTLFNDGKKDEAAQYLRIAAKYDPSMNIYLQECEETKDIEPGR
ncbi:ALBINO3-like protein 3, mitochondrial isoform X1 [Cryptomeria japonica]|uniref:ALBINO3-like protein 3, mitochondrial isoform X1 n=2 Tax=Cryptomeria japonica TaxID=3369 RepID=UPI0027DA75E1|nr:ALBINO3-like protein 3, mitochondrial isoform X1 [Cryptomeria japonica]